MVGSLQPTAAFAVDADSPVTASQWIGFREAKGAKRVDDGAGTFRLPTLTLLTSARGAIGFG
jgi:hypothetical protein